MEKWYLELNGRKIKITEKQAKKMLYYFSNKDNENSIFEKVGKGKDSYFIIYGCKVLEQIDQEMFYK